MSTSSKHQTPAERKAQAAEARRRAPYLLFILLVSIVSLLVVAADLNAEPGSEVSQVLLYADTFLCGLFFIDFLSCLIRAENRWKYMITWGWLDLISSIPAIHVARWGRAARALRVLRLLRGIRSARILLRFILEQRAQSAALAATIASIVAVGLASISVLHFERPAVDANIRTAEDALWWSVVTLTTVGYGYHYPVTNHGRLVAVVLMAAGIALIGTWSGIATSWFLRAGERRQEHDLEALHRDLKKLRELLEAREAQPLSEHHKLDGGLPPADG